MIFAVLDVPGRGIEMPIDKSKINAVTPLVGRLNEKRLMRWTPIRACGDWCEMHSSCPHASKAQVKKVKCEIEKTYLNTIYDEMINTLGDDLTQVDLYAIGFRYMALHHQLIKLQKAFYVEDWMMSEGKHGVRYLNPLMREIRCVVRDINVMEEGLKLREKFLKKMGKEPVQVGRGGSGAKEAIDVGTKGYYEAIFEGEGGEETSEDGAEGGAEG